MDRIDALMVLSLLATLPGVWFIRIAWRSRENGVMRDWGAWGIGMAFAATAIILVIAAAGLS